MASKEDIELGSSSAGNDMDAVRPVNPPERVSAGAHISSMEQYKQMHERSLKEPEAFWAEMARNHLSWFRDFTEV